MKVAYVYTVRRESTIKSSQLDAEIEFFKGVKDEPGEYLFSDSDGEVSVEMQVSRDGKDWNTIYGDPR